MTLLGIPPQMAGITFKLGKIGDNVWWLILFYKHGHIPKQYVLGWGIALFCGSFLGSYFIAQISDAVMYLGSWISMLVLATVSLYKKEIPSQKISKIREYIGYIVYFFLSVLGNLFPAGSGVWYYFTNTILFHLSPIEAKGIAWVLALFWFPGTLLGILFSWVYTISYALALWFGMLIWGYLGTKHLIHLGNNFLKRTILVSIFLFSLYFLYQWIILL